MLDVDIGIDIGSGISFGIGTGDLTGIANAPAAGIRRAICPASSCCCCRRRRHRCDGNEYHFKLLIQRDMQIAQLPIHD